MSSQRQTFFLIQPPLTASPDQEILGRFYANPLEPAIAFVPNDPRRLTKVLAKMKQVPVEEELTNFHRQTKDFNGSQVQAQLAGIFGLSRDVDKSATVTVQSPRGIVRKAQQVQYYFDRLLEDETILVELVDMLRKNRGVAYMAVATLTLSDAELTIDQDVTNNIRTNSGDGLTLAPQSPADGGTRQRSQSRMEERFKAEGMRIIGISYMKVIKHRFISFSGVTLHRKPVQAGKDAVYGDGDNGRRSQGFNKKDYSTADIELAPLSPYVDEHAKNWVSITLGI